LPNIDRHSSGIQRLPSDSGLLLFDSLSNRLLAFNQSARFLWELIERGFTLDKIASEFAANYGVPVESARKDIDAIIGTWRSLDLLSSDREPDSYSGPVPLQDVPDWSQTRTPAWAANAVYSVRDKVFSLSIEPPNSVALIRTFFQHLEIPKGEVGLRLEIRQATNSLRALLVNGSEQFRTLDEAQLVGGVCQAILEYLHPEVEWLAMVHGAAIARGDAGLVFPAASGSGKTTLVAHLAAQDGFTYLADDLVVLAAPSGHIVPWPMPLSIKRGSWSLLFELYPSLKSAPIYNTSRGEARLLIPSSSDWKTDPVLAHGIVFPRYIAGAVAKLTRITAFEAIERLLNDRIWLGYPMTEHRIRAFLAWIDVTPAYTLVHGNVADAARCLEDLP
jgi:Coenzyme PQQ synthesis protein D (PqqD)